MPNPITSYRPQKDSLPGRVIDFFASNPEEGLTAHDIGIKFGCHQAGVHTQLGRCIDAGLLARTRNDDGDMVYSAPTRATPPASDAPKPPPKPAAPAQPTRATPFRLNLQAVQIERGVPLPPPRLRGTAAEVWDALLCKLKTGESFLLPREGAPSARKQITRYAKSAGRQFACRMMDDGLRVWRTA